MALIAVTNGSLDSTIFDNGLQALTTNSDDLHLCSQAPTNYTEATSTYTLGDKQAITVSSPQAGATGREVAVSAITTGGDVTGTGTATHYAIVDVSNTLLLAVGSLSASQAVTSGNTFTLAAFDIELPAA
jgi:hypothetical protein